MTHNLEESSNFDFFTPEIYTPLPQSLLIFQDEQTLFSTQCLDSSIPSMMNPTIITPSDSEIFCVISLERPSEKPSLPATFLNNSLRWEQNLRIHYEYLQFYLRKVLANPGLISFKTSKRPYKGDDKQFASEFLGQYGLGGNEQIAKILENKVKSRFRTMKRRYQENKRKRNRKSRNSDDSLDFPELLLKKARQLVSNEMSMRELGSCQRLKIVIEQIELQKSCKIS